MDEPRYAYEHSLSEIKYDFWSISHEKQVRKRVIFTTSENRVIYNLALVDVFEDGTVSDISETRNKDIRMVLATVVSILDKFLQENPNKMVAFRGSDERRQRLYRLVISRELETIKQKFTIFGGFDSHRPELFKPNENYDYFLILKNNQNEN